jgi:predicted Zn-dependent protease
MKIVKKLPHDQVNHGDSSPGRQFLMLGACLLVLAVGVYYAAGAIISRAVLYVPQNLEHRLFSRLVLHSEFVKNTQQNPHAQALLDRLAQATPEISLPLRIIVIFDSVSNAMALPGGIIIITDKLLQDVGSENELAMVLAHELGHFTLRHHLRRVSRLLLLPALTAVLFGDASTTGLVSRSSTLFELSYSRAEESAADSFALDTLNRVYGHVAGATEFFQRNASLDSQELGGKYGSSHPLSTERVRAIDLQIDQKGYKRGNLTALPPTQ